MKPEPIPFPTAVPAPATPLRDELARAASARTLSGILAYLILSQFAAIFSILEAMYDAWRAGLVPPMPAATPYTPASRTHVDARSGSARAPAHRMPPAARQPKIPQAGLGPSAAHISAVASPRAPRRPQSHPPIMRPQPGPRMSCTMAAITALRRAAPLASPHPFLFSHAPATCRRTSQLFRYSNIQPAASLATKCPAISAPVATHTSPRASA